MQRPPILFSTTSMTGPGVSSPGRRQVLKLMAASAALLGSGCSKPPEKILPYVNMPEGVVPGDPVFYASTLLRRGYGIGVLVETESGRPIKIEGNVAHPASLGAADAQAQAEILTLWDPERSRTIMQDQQLSTWPALLEAVGRCMQDEAKTGGKGLRLLTGPISSPTLLAQIGEILARFPEARWHLHDPADSDERAAAMRQVFHRPARTVYRLDRAHVVLSVDADLFDASPDGVRNAHDFMIARRRSPRARLYALESSPNLCGALADSRYSFTPGQMEAVLEEIAARLGRGGALESSFDAPARPWLDALCRQLAAAHGNCVVAPGRSLSARAHIAAWRINAMLGNLGSTLFALEEEGPRSRNSGGGDAAGNDNGGLQHSSSLVELINAMHDRRVETLIMLDTNPVYDAPGSLDFITALAQVPCSIHMGLYRDETAHRATWHVPMVHELESWGDARSHDGTPSIIQPVISPLYGGHSPHTLLNVLAAGLPVSAHERVRATWRGLWQEDGDAAFESRWRTALSRGIIEGVPDRLPLAPAFEAFRTVDRAFARPPLPPPESEHAPELRARNESTAGLPLVAVFANDSNVVAGEYANNAWLQELPRPYTKITWDNAALISPVTAAAHGLQNGDIVAVTAEDALKPVMAPIWILPGQGDGVITLPLGYGRSHASSTAQNCGFDAYALQGVVNGGAQRTRTVTISGTGRRHEFARTQHEMRAHGRDPVRIVPEPSEPASGAKPQERNHPPPSLYAEHPYESYAWGMTIDLDACIGCNACAIACQSENNIPVVGPEQVALGREMHWIRIDLYRDEASNRTQFQPMACQHCKNAPCEVVCPVGATMHDSEGLNVQVYNRCVGTRFCSNNCPYKVRRFNFFQYSEKDPSSAARANPDVTVRQRGVMEKCSYCVQRISHARIVAQKERRGIRDGEVVTACQATCPTNAIVFGDTNDPHSHVSRSKTASRNYAVLEEMNTRPRTTYLARIEDPAARLELDDDRER